MWQRLSGFNGSDVELNPAVSGRGESRGAGRRASDHQMGRGVVRRISLATFSRWKLLPLCTLLFTPALLFSWNGRLKSVS